MQNFMIEIEPVYTADKPELLQPREKLFRFDSPQSRYYFRFPAQGEEIAYLGATGATDRLLGISEGLLRWYAKNGEVAYIMSKIAADYGTMMHIAIGDFEKAGRVIQFEQLEELGFSTAMQGGFPFAAPEWAFFLPRNIASWIVFCEEHEVEVLAVEFPVWSDKYSVATLCDIYCELTFSRKRYRAIINLKKGYLDDARADESKTFYEGSDLQLQIERLLWRECTPHLPVDMIFNWAPNNWTEKPTYTLKNWTDKTRFSEETLTRMLPLIRLVPGNFSPPKKVSVLHGAYKKGDDINANIRQERMKAPKATKG